MPQKNRLDLYDEFKNGDIPNETDFADTIDSALNLVDDGLISYKVDTPVGTLKRFGIGGETSPDCPLGIKGEPGQDDQMICFTSSDESHKWNINLNPTGQSITGFSIDDQTSGISSSRFFIDQQSEGNVGIGTVEPEQKLHVRGANDGANVSIMVENLESGADSGWLMSAIDDNAVPERVRTFAIQEKNGPELFERITILSGGDPANPQNNVGVNEILPMATLHVSSPQSSPFTPLGMAENTGILLLGPVIGPNLVMDTHQVQARTGEYVASGPTLAFTANKLGLQPYGGGIIINESFSPDKQLIISDDGNIGVGKTPVEKIDINGAVTIGDTSTPVPADGTVRFGGPNADLEVWMGNQWNSLTTHTLTDGLWVNGGNGIIYYDTAAGNPKVGIGVTTPNSALHVKDDSQDVFGNIATVAVVNNSGTTSPDPGLMRTGIAVQCSGIWSTNSSALNVGLYVKSVTGQTAAESNIAALINGNTVIGDVTGQTIVGQNGVNVLAIQNGAAPTSIPGITPNTGIQIYSQDVVGADGIGRSAFRVMNGDGNVITLSRQASLEPASLTVPDTGDANTNALIENMRLRINQLENIIKALGVVAS